MKTTTKTTRSQANGVYEASATKRRRRTKPEIEQLREAIFDVCLEHKPLTARQCYYRLVAAGEIEKTANEYNNVVVRLLVDMRRSGDIPFRWIVDSTRWVRRPKAHSSLADALEETQSHYRRRVWDDQPKYVEVWCESDSVGGVLWEVTRKWDTPLLSCRGFASWSFCHTAAQVIRANGKPTTILYAGDADPSGLSIDADIQAKLRECGADFAFRRIAVTPEQIEQLQLPGQPPKKTDTRAKGFKGKCVEIEAIPPKLLLQILERHIVRHIDQDAYRRLLTVEAEEKRTLATVLDSIET